MNLRICSEMDKEDTKKKTEPKVVVFGNEVGDAKNEECCKENGSWRDFGRRRRHGSFTWGLFFILLGLLFLLSNFGALPPIVWSQIARLWPVLIVLIGFDTLLGHSEVSEVVSSFIGLFIFLTVLGVVFVNVSPQLLQGLPAGILNYFHSISSYLQLK
jgi:hypothetical protein